MIVPPYTKTEEMSITKKTHSGKAVRLTITITSVSADGITGLVDVGSAQLLQGFLVGVVGQGCVENVDDIELGQPGGHGTAAEHGFVGGGVELVIRQLGHGGLDEPGDGNDGGLVLPQRLHALDDLHGGTGVGHHDGHVIGGGVSRLEKLGVPVLVDDAQLVQPQELEVCILGGTEGCADAEEIDHLGLLEELHALAQNPHIQQ